MDIRYLSTLVTSILMDIIAEKSTINSISGNVDDPVLTPEIISVMIPDSLMMFISENIEECCKQGLIEGRNGNYYLTKNNRDKAQVMCAIGEKEFLKKEKK